MEPGGLQSIGSKESDTAEHVTTLAFTWGWGSKGAFWAEEGQELTEVLIESVGCLWGMDCAGGTRGSREPREEVSRVTQPDNRGLHQAMRL